MTFPSTLMPKKRFVSLSLPHFAIENHALLRQKQKPPENKQRKSPAPLALVDNTSRGQRLSAVDDQAAQQGLVSGMALSDALTLCPLLQTPKAAPQSDAHRLLQLARWCERYGPLSNGYDEDSLWIDVTGTTHLFDGEKGLLEKIQQDFSNLGYTTKLALADSFGAAFALARFAFEDELESRIIPPDQCQQALAPLPIEALRLSPKILSLLHRLGLSTIGQLMELPRDTLKRRFPSREQARSALLRLDQMFGLRDEPLVPLARPFVFASRLRFAYSLTSKQMLEQALTRLIANIIEQLEKQHQGARKLTFTLWRSDGSASHIKIGANRPCRDSTHLFNLFKEKLDRIEPGFGIDIIGLFVDKTEPLSARQSSLADERQRHHATSPSVLIDRLGNRLGEQKIGYLDLLESHIPERAQQLTTAPPAGATWNEMSGKRETPFSHERPFLLLNPAEAIHVMAPLPDDPPLLFIWRRVTRKVIDSSGPERINPEWWCELGQKASRPRDYYKVRTNRGSTFWLYRDGLYEGDEKSTSPPQWYMHGFFG